MQKLFGSIMFIAGTCIGSGMIALPMVLAKLGIIPSSILMLCIWAVIYYTSLVNIELNLQAGGGTALGELGKQNSGRIAQFVGNGSFKLLTYSLLAVYIYGGSSVLQNMFYSFWGISASFNHIASIYSLVMMLMLSFSLKSLDYFNRLLFAGLLLVVFVLIVALLASINWSNLPLFVSDAANLSVFRIALPVIFTAFGFQVIFHILTDYCENDAKVLRKAFFWGSLIPALIYLLWNTVILSAIYQNNSSFYHVMLTQKIEVGDLVSVLSKIATIPFVQTLIWILSLLAIVTSVLGVGAGVRDSMKSMLMSKKENKYALNFVSAFITIFPAYVLAILIPNAFIKILGFAGMILVVIAILLPVYLLCKANPIKLYYSVLKSKLLLTTSIIIGILIILCEAFNMLN